MFDFSFGELLVVALVALIVLGPERLPKAARFTGLWVRRARAQWNSVKDELERELAADELKRELQQARDALQRAGSELHHADAEVRAGIDEARRLPAAAAEPPAAGETPSSAPSAAPNDEPPPRV